MSMSDQAESARTRSCTRLLYMPARMKIAPTTTIPITIRGVMFSPETGFRKEFKGSSGSYHTKSSGRKLLACNKKVGTLVTGIHMIANLWIQDLISWRDVFSSKQSYVLCFK